MRRLVVCLSAAALAAGSVACSDEAPRRVAKRTATTAPATTSTTVAPSTTTTTPPPPPDFGATVSDDPVAVAGALAAAEAATLDPATPPPTLQSAALALQLGYRKIAKLDVSREQAVHAALPEEGTRQALGANVAAARYLFALAGSAPPKPTPPAGWTILPPAPPEELLGYYKEASATTGVPWSILASVHFIESKFGRVRGPSSAGALGPMQFLPSTWAAYGQGDINSNRDAIAAAARYLKANGAPERLDDAIFRYNHSKHYVEAIKAYARRMAADERSFRGYHQWPVLVRTTAGTTMLPEGWPATPLQVVAPL